MAIAHSKMKSFLCSSYRPPVDRHRTPEVRRSGNLCAIMTPNSDADKQSEFLVSIKGEDKDMYVERLEKAVAFSGRAAMGSRVYATVQGNFNILPIFSSVWPTESGHFLSWKSEYTFAKVYGALNPMLMLHNLK
ncbi:hypothetical protein EVAR_62545_1 [Eumeta japonica]|uniref:Uncharacterized protein n=1 Tax=Eumeta variegata TaxID=151549 RepID=A0A4C1YVW0_EUMVA|nr:hypothetical protein EVAR_62545_1 [Eumeta japonica]